MDYFLAVDVQATQIDDQHDEIKRLLGEIAQLKGKRNKQV